MTVGGNNLVTVQPEELKFIFELAQQSHCDLRIANTTEHYVAFKVKTTSPKKYFVRPNSGVIQPWDSCIIRVTLQAQREYPPDMQSKDKFLLQSTKVPPHFDIDDLPQDTFNKDSGKAVEECKLKVSYIIPGSNSGDTEDVEMKSGQQGREINQIIQHLKEERDAAVRQTQILRQDLETLRRRRQSKGSAEFPLKFTVLVGVMGIMVGLLLSMKLSATQQS